MRVIFLDVDGVLNNLQAFKDQAGNGMGTRVLCPVAVQNLFGLLAWTGAQIVLSSTWRKGREPNEHVAYLRAARVLDRAHEDWRTKDYVTKATPVTDGDYSNATGYYGCRGDEIAEWLSRHPEVTQYVILDDDGDMLEEQKPFFVQTDFQAGGLTMEKAKAALDIFSAMGTP